ncbi:MAG: ParA family protein [Pseudomonadota bacterium]|nr:ParA family protein [Pseudomonadota bacterium]MDE3036976.1 ParA family protein [Pseudomonadota bacterium]
MTVEIRGNPRVLAIVNQKGGVGKTTTTVNLATALAAVHKKVLVIDFDPQGNASTGFGLSADKREITSYDIVLGDVGIDEAVQKTAVPDLSIVPSTIDLSGAEIEMVSLMKREYRLKQAIDKNSAAYDYVLIDCPPSLGLLTINALVAADAVLIPLQCEFYALEGLSHLMRTIQLVQTNLNDKLAIQGIVLTMYDRRNKLTEQIENDVRSYFGEKVYSVVIPRNIRMSEAPSHGKPALIYDMRCAGSQAYIQLARELLGRERRRLEEMTAA